MRFNTLLLFCLILACSPLAGAADVAATPSATTQAALSLPAGSRVLTDVQYVEGGSSAQRLDLYLPPPGKSPAPLIVWIHGGGWSGGSKKSCPAAAYLAKGYAAASLDYRLSKEAVFPAQINDCKAAIRFLRANAARFNLDAQRIGVWGHSAGAHLASLLGVSAEAKDLEGGGGNAGESSRVLCVVDYAGPVDLTTIIDEAAARKLPNLSPLIGITRHLLGGNVKDKLELARSASPISYVSKGAAAFLIIQAEGDEFIPMEQAARLDAALKAAGVESTLIVVKKGTHWMGPYPPGTQAAVERFFDEHLKK